MPRCVQVSVFMLCFFISPIYVSLFMSATFKENYYSGKLSFTEKGEEFNLHHTALKNGAKGMYTSRHYRDTLSCRNRK